MSECNVSLPSAACATLNPECNAPLTATHVRLQRFEQHNAPFLFNQVCISNGGKDEGYGRWWWRWWWWWRWSLEGFRLLERVGVGHYPHLCMCVRVSVIGAVCTHSHVWASTGRVREVKSIPKKYETSCRQEAPTTTMRWTRKTNSCGECPWTGITSLLTNTIWAISLFIVLLSGVTSSDIWSKPVHTWIGSRCNRLKILTDRRRQLSNSKRLMYVLSVWEISTHWTISPKMCFVDPVECSECSSNPLIVLSFCSFWQSWRRWHCPNGSSFSYVHHQGAI